MPNACTDIQSTRSAYLDGELQDIEVREFETHINDCETCQNSFEESEQEHSALRAHLRTTPPASEFMTKRILSALDKEDEKLRRSTRRQWISVPVVSSVLAAAALLLFVWTNVIPTEETEVVAQKSSQVTQDVARQHLREAPLFVSNDRGKVGRGAAEFLEERVRAPRFSSREVKLLGWTPVQLGGKQSATFVYEVTNETGRHRVHAHAVALAKVDFRSQTKLIIDGAELWVDGAYGFNTVTYHPRDARIAYVFSSDMSVDSLVAMVARTDTVNSVRP